MAKIIITERQLRTHIQSFRLLKELRVHPNIVELLRTGEKDNVALAATLYQTDQNRSLFDTFTPIAKWAGINEAEPWMELEDLFTTEELTLSGAQLRQTPDNVQHLDTLDDYTLIDLGGVLPATVGKLKNAKYLSMQKNNLKKLPASIANLQKLEWLDISENAFREFPEAITSLTNLKTLKLNDNSIRVLPPSIARLTNLKQLDLSRTGLGYPENRKGKIQKMLPNVEIKF